MLDVRLALDQLQLERLDGQSFLLRVMICTLQHALHGGDDALERDLDIVVALVEPREQQSRKEITGAHKAAMCVMKN